MGTRWGCDCGRAIPDMGEAKRHQNRRDFSKCAYCGQPATSRDHVPPKCIFPENRHNLITVPACENHNQSKSNLDELLMQFVGIFAAQIEPLNSLLWNRAWTSLDRGQRGDLVRSRIVHDARSKLTAIPMEAEPFMGSTKLVVRGLYWHHTGNCLDLNTPVSTSMWKSDAQLPLLHLMKVQSVAGGQFVYAFGIAEDDAKASIWYIQFQKNILVGAYTGSLADHSDHQT